MERLKHVRDTLLSCVESQLGDLRNVDAEELGEVVDMVKDMEEAMYYCSITKATKEESEEKRDMDKHSGRMYYEDKFRGKWKYEDRYRPDHDEERDWDDKRTSLEMDEHKLANRDPREGRSPMSRKNYIESKEMHKGSSAQMKELEKYIHELSQDITEMIEGASPEEKAVLQQKLSGLISKINNV